MRRSRVQPSDSAPVKSPADVVLLRTLGIVCSYTQIAQLAELRTVNPLVVGSNPTLGAKQRNTKCQNLMQISHQSNVMFVVTT
jgi:hypothetical protein